MARKRNVKARFLATSPQVSGVWSDCSRQSCCPGYTLIVGRCVSADVDPCSIDGICEHRCDVYFGRVVCTCHLGYRSFMSWH